MYQLHSQRTALRTICCDVGLFIQSVSYPLKLFFPLICHHLSPYSISRHCLAFSSPFLSYLLPAGYRRLTFSKLSDGYLPQRRKVKGSLQNSSRARQEPGILPCAGNCL